MTQSTLKYKNLNSALVQLRSHVSNQIGTGPHHFTKSHKLKTLTNEAPLLKYKPYSESLYNTGKHIVETPFTRQNNPMYIPYFFNKPKTLQKFLASNKAMLNKYDALMSDLGISGYSHFENAVIRDLEKREEQKVEATIHTLFETHNTIPKTHNSTDSINKVASSDLYSLNVRNEHNLNKIPHFDRTITELNKIMPKQNNTKHLDKVTAYSNLKEEDIGFVVHKTMNSSTSKNASNSKKTEKSALSIFNTKRLKQKERKLARYRNASDPIKPSTTTLIQRGIQTSMDKKLSRFRVNVSKKLDLVKNKNSSSTQTWENYNQNEINSDNTTISALISPEIITLSKQLKQNFPYGHTFNRKLESYQVALESYATSRKKVADKQKPKSLRGSIKFKDHYNNDLKAF